MSTLVVVAAVAFGLIAACVTLVTLHSLRVVEKCLGEFEDDDRCPSILEWHEAADKLKQTTSVTRCTLRTGHGGPHHAKRPGTDDDHWWPRKESDEFDLEQTRKIA